MRIVAAAFADDLASLQRCIHDDVNEVDPNGRTALMVAARFNRVAIATRLLRESRLQINMAQQNALGETALMIACIWNHVEIIDLILQDPRNQVNGTMDRSETAMHFACYLGYDGVVQRLLESPDIQINRQNDQGLTPLMLAAENGHLEISRRLVGRRDIRLDSTNHSGQTAWDLAKFHQHHAIQRVIGERRLCQEWYRYLQQTNPRRHQFPGYSYTKDPLTSTPTSTSHKDTTERSCDSDVGSTSHNDTTFSSCSSKVDSQLSSRPDNKQVDQHPGASGIDDRLMVSEPLNEGDKQKSTTHTLCSTIETIDMIRSCHDENVTEDEGEMDVVCCCSISFTGLQRIKDWIDRSQ